MKRGNSVLRIRELRTEKNATQQEIADKLGVSRQVFANWENEINQPDLHMLVSLADYFGVTADYLLGRTDDFGNAVMPDSQLSIEETEIVRLFRNMNDSQKDRFVAYGEGLIGTTPKFKA